MSESKDLSKFNIKKPSFVSLAVGSFMHSLSLNKYDGEIRQFKNINGYKLLTTIKKENGYMDCSVGCYTHQGKKFFIKTFEADKNDYRYYFVINEWFISNVLYEMLKSKKSQIMTPKPIRIISFDKSISLVYEFIEGKTLNQFSTSYQTKVFIQIISELKKISSSLTKDEIKLIPKRSIIFYLISLPYLSLMTFFRTDRNLKLIIKAFLITLKLLLSQKINGKLILAHRDLKPHNGMIKESKIFLTDVGRMALTVPGYDLAFLSLDPTYTSLTKSLEKKLKTFTSKFLKSYIALQFADSISSIGMGKKYWEFLKSEYANTNLKKGYDVKSNNQSFPEENKFSMSLLFSKGILALRYLYHFLFSSFYHLGTKVTFGSGVAIHNAKYISLGNKVYLEKNVTLKFLEEFIKYGYKRPTLKIEEAVTIGTGTVIATSKFIHIKKNVLVAPHCFIGDHDHEYRDITIPIRDQGYKNVKKIIIEEGAWIGANSTICSGVTIGKNSVVGANSVVTKDIPDFSLAVGVPAKVVKRFNTVTKTWERISSPSVLKHRNWNIKPQSSSKSILGRRSN